MDFENRPNNLPVSPEVIYTQLTVKPHSLDGQTPCTVFKTQFDLDKQMEGLVKVSKLVASLRRSAAEVLRGIPVHKLTDLTKIEKALDFRFGGGYLTQFYRTEFKTR
ncbi:hypothetical protein AVEN_151072-1 [Araneus ventricosus]|uniref:Uncharacterized protein n=1 Tax=Araneus ventricosus TaxID=182803 RepID=A0A4Y2QRR6_ARAVE|nr:hypothetical protein AVEN_151072-1 [Araneus ventricosus]